MNPEILDTIDAILQPDALSVSFQPIYAIRGYAARCVLLEGLSRGRRGTRFERANELFATVRRLRQEVLVDRACAVAIVSEAGSLLDGRDLSINVHAATVGNDPGLADFLAETLSACGIPPAKLIVEIVEHKPVSPGNGFAGAVRRLRAAGFRIALDDFGVGHSNFEIMVDCRPELVKIDRCLVHGISRDPYRHAVVDSILRLAEGLGVQVVAEGLEEPADLDAVVDLGVDMVQGFVLSRPLGLDELPGIRSELSLLAHTGSQISRQGDCVS